MSTDLTEQVWRERGDLSSTEKIVLLRIADRINRQNGVAWPSVRSLAGHCGLSKTATLDILGRLIEKQYVKVAKPHSGNRPRTYGLNLDRLCGQASGHKLCSSGGWV